MEIATLKAERRTRIGGKAVYRLRAEGKIPGIIYGHGETPEPISVDAHDFVVALEHGARTMTLDVEGRATQHLIKEVQYDALGSKVIHADFMRVDVNERVRVSVGIELRGVPKGVAEGGVLDQPLAEIEVECLAMAIPDTLRPLVTHLGVGESLLVADIPVPEGVVVMDDPDTVVATVRVLTGEIETEVVEAEGESAMPELIGRRAEEPTEEEK